MGGQEGSKGYLYQGLVTILESLQENYWTEIFVEYASISNKVDIALALDNKLIKTIQVKSSVNLFSKSNIKNWITALVNDEKATEYQLCLIGACDKYASIFAKSINKFKEGNIDQETENSIVDFRKILSQHSVSVKILPYDEDSLIGVVRDKIHKYISDKNYILAYDVLEELSLALLAMNTLLGTKGNYISKAEYDEKIFNWLNLSSNGLMKKQGSFSNHNVYCYNPLTNELQTEFKPLVIQSLPGYKDIYSDLYQQGKLLIDKIDSIKLLAYDKPNTTTQSMNEPHIARQLQPNKSTIPISLMLANMTNSAETSEKRKQELIQTIKDLWGINIDVSFFFVGNLTRNNIFTTGDISYEGKDIEKEKNCLLSELGSVVFKMENLKYYSETLKNIRIIPLCIKNISDFSDEDITISVLFDKTICKIYDAQKNISSDEREILNILADILIEEKMLESIYLIHSNDGIVIEEKDYMPPLYRPLIFDSFCRMRKTPYDFESLIFELSKYIADVETDGVIKYSINSLRAGESKWLLPWIFILNPDKDLDIQYRILSKKSDGKKNGAIKIIKQQ